MCITLLLILILSLAAAFHLSAHLLFQQTCNKKRAHRVGGAEKALIGYFSNGQGQRKDTF